VSSGGYFSYLRGIAGDGIGDLFVTQQTSIVRVNPLTGSQVSVSSGGLFSDLKGIAVVPSVPVIEPFCFGDGSAIACPCGNNGAPGRGCENSASTGGAVLDATGSTRVSTDTVVLTASGELASALTIFFSGTTAIAHTNFGDGLRCTGGHLSRLYVKSAVLGVTTAPGPGDPSITARMIGLGHPISGGETRNYQVYYRDNVESFCPDNVGNRFNVTSGIRVRWGP